MKTYKVNLKPRSEITSIPSSDTLFGAICWGIRLLYGEAKLKEILSRFVSNAPPFVLSSSFPISSSGIMFLPKPKLKRLSPETIISIAKERCKVDKRKESMFNVMSRYKRFAKISYLSESLFKAVLEGKVSEESLFKDYLNETIAEKGGFLLKEESHLPQDKFSCDEIRVRTKIDRLSSSTIGEGEMFHSETKIISGGFSLFFLLKTDEIEFLKTLIDKDKFLSDHGVGGDRTIGLNHFKLSVEETDLKLGGEGKRFVTLSKYIPNSNEINTDGDGISYDVIPWVSRVDNSYDFQGERFIKDRVFYMKEGSVFEVNERKEFHGRVMKVCNIGEERIYQNGLAFPLFFNS